MNQDKGQDAGAIVLAELSAERIEDMESAVFTEIGRERRVSRRARRRAWMTAGAAAAVIVAVVAVAPVVGGVVTGSSGGDAAVAPGAPDTAVDSDVGDSLMTGSASSAADVRQDGRDIISSATATVRVDDVAGAIAGIGSAVTDRGGYVESTNTGAVGGFPMPVDGTDFPLRDGGFITVRVPADDLQATIDALDAFGTVEASGLSRFDVTSEAVDLRARIDAGQTSVDRLTELVARAQSVADLLAAESALTERQAALESYQQQLKGLDEQVELSSLSVTLVPRDDTVTADPAGFGDGLIAGFNGLVASLNAVVVGIGFLLPWIMVIAVVGAIVWGILALIRRRRRPPVTAPRD